jgi:Putative addiction module component
MDRNAIIQEILSLSSADRAFIADILSASLANEFPPQLSPSEQREMLRRVEMFEKHPETFESWQSLKSKLAERRKLN